MHIDSYFSLSNSSLDDAKYVLYGIPYDSTQSFKPGSRFAPQAIREASWNLEEFSNYFNFDLSNLKLCDAGNVRCDGDFEDIIPKVFSFIEKVDAKLIALGGEHTISFAASQKFKDFTYLSLDAHFDLRESFDGKKFNHACTLKRIYERGVEVVVAGVRSGTKEEVEFARSEGIKFFYSWNFDVKSIAESLDDRVYISLDMDVFDPSFAPGVSTPEPFGIHPFQFLKLLEVIADKIIAFDVVEVVPDPCKITQNLAAKLIFETLAAIESKINSRA
ncbi:MAG: agmatinase [Archaeoglobaceae archaeon]|nr:agmatinase [Archaeoglobaceae archaeon]MCX8152352.1 agmatinase [Archaeoglobaceae archaeon]MDW8014189.1 agmatinase [Archaeoglobaceae archaeon]